MLPIQAQGKNDRLSTVQTRQDIGCCSEKLPQLLYRPISAQFVDADLIALFELYKDGDDIGSVEERHDRLAPADQITRDDLWAYET